MCFPVEGTPDLSVLKELIPVLLVIGSVFVPHTKWMGALPSLHGGDAGVPALPIAPPSVCPEFFWVGCLLGCGPATLIFPHFSWIGNLPAPHLFDEFLPVELVVSGAWH